MSYNTFVKFFGDRDWRIWLGIGVSVVWIGSGVIYVSNISETDPTQNFSLEAVGSFLEGAFAPLAFL